MTIESNQYILKLDNEEMWTMLSALKKEIESGVSHASQFEGMTTLKNNRVKAFNMLESVCNVLNAHYMFDDFVTAIQADIDKLVYSKEQ